MGSHRRQQRFSTCPAPFDVFVSLPSEDSNCCSTSGRPQIDDFQQRHQRRHVQPNTIQLTWQIHGPHVTMPFAAIGGQQQGAMAGRLLLNGVAAAYAARRQYKSPGRHRMALGGGFSMAQLPFAAISMPWQQSTADEMPLDVFQAGESVGAGRYTVQKKLLDGRFASIWLATDATSGAEVVLKTPQDGDLPTFHEALREVAMTRHAQPPSQAPAAASADIGASAKHPAQPSSGTLSPQQQPLSGPTTIGPAAPPIGDSAATSAAANPSVGAAWPPVVRFLGQFEHQSPAGRHVCMVLEPLGSNLYNLMGEYMGGLGVGLPSPVVKAVTRQALQALDYLHRERGLIHMDIKPDNLLFTRPFASLLMVDAGTILRQRAVNMFRHLLRQPEEMPPLAQIPAGMLCERDIHLEPMRLIDFGRARPVAEAHIRPASATGMVVFDNPGYRPPEQILALGNEYGPGFDMWQLGCLVWWMSTGQDLFAPANGEGFDCDEKHLSEMASVLRQHPPLELVSRSPVRSRFFMKSGRLKMEARYRIVREGLDKILITEHNMDDEEAQGLMDFLEPLFEYEPSKRPSAEQMLQHPWLLEGAAATEDAALPAVLANTGATSASPKP